MSQPKRHQRSKQELGQHDPKECNHVLNGKHIHLKSEKATEGKESVKIYDADGVRDLIVPNRNPIDIPGILGQSEFERLKKQATVLTIEDKMRMLAESEKKKNQLQEESDQRKEQLLKAQKKKQGRGTKIDTIEQEAANKNSYLLRRSKELMLEQDDRVKAANATILAAKCRAIRNAQIAEKKLIDEQLHEEEMRLDKMMEQTRQKMIQQEENKKTENEKKKNRYVTEVQQQMKENEMLRLIEAERIEEESRMLNKALIELAKQEEEQLKEKAYRQQLMREEFKKFNDEAEYYKQMRQEEQRIADLRIQEFMRQKAEREELKEKERALAKAAKEQEIARMRAQQQKSQDLQAKMDEINALRRQEEKEKEWRDQEKQAAMKRAQMNKDLREARQKQIEDIRKAEALALVRDEEDFMRVVKVQRELFQKELENQKRKKDEVARHRKQLLKQIDEKERERITWQSEKFEDGRAQRLEYKVKDREVEDYLKYKIEKLKETNIPEQYISDIERKLKLQK